MVRLGVITCDACGIEISRKEVEPTFPFMSVNFPDFCKDCFQAYEEWKKSRRK